MKEKITEYLNSRFPEVLLPQRDINTNLLYFLIKKESLPIVVQALKDHSEFAFTYLNDLTSVDWLGKREPRFEVVYLLRSPKNKHFRLQLRVPVEEGEEVPSLVSIFPAANWPEREVFDLMGIPFSNHPQMERLIMPDNFIGHPLRKDYPLEGPGQDYLIEDLLTIHVNEDIAS
ncbi:NADH-quinone oxidoreductase subunit C [Leptospira sp. 2 VSF19]|uniref:NADH-quinone oxidoreductase subunit C n=1 Tax=Leptospira soteropolitanensis TaxID=2950025 RepID=A0AAW5VKF6_9LEPT|nr:NADH-quinone oxidoreductase subunit C [Leptospira soteropolitanensis]MCW7492961.1 NADH-quinone oxidoreductase subunit C [Leptospira soteropolitanensis]MCW7500196.1 NADH-quinone oxidoreductase subunit C [Leptospira soteropolitanensis]MCW7522447.1 NADH-quinone oxidoreductase subunit C [Leptospira soteropolitanensis]MCW7526303.1 NADH-quinone oxidoreductase subunit C [Leptospira soteropolitanensis]MCW7529585.1 NADH-quinone oxidoreductase subunit C [Leptospira soteropolitanensis]